MHPGWNRSRYLRVMDQVHIGLQHRRYHECALTMSAMQQTRDNYNSVIGLPDFSDFCLDESPKAAQKRFDPLDAGWPLIRRWPANEYLLESSRIQRPRSSHRCSLAGQYHPCNLERPILPYLQTVSAHSSYLIMIYLKCS